MSENLDNIIGVTITSNKEVIIPIKTKVKGKIYKLKEEFGHTYAYIEDEDGRLFRFDINEITLI